MDKNKIANELFLHLTESPSTGAESKVIRALAERTAEANVLNPPDQVWRNIQNKIATASVAHASGGFLNTLRSFVSAPLFPVFALAVAGIMVGAVFLLNRATEPRQLQIVEIAAQRPLKKGDLLLAKGMRIENSVGGGISHINAPTEKIVFHSGEWKVALRHAELEKPMQFVFPGGALEPLGTAFNIKIYPQGTDVQLTEGKIRLLQFHSENGKWESRELSAPFHGVLAPQPLNTEPVVVTPEKIPTVPIVKPAIPARYVPYLGKEITIELKNGDRLSGRLRSATNGKIVLASASGNLNIRDADVVAIGRK